MAYEKEGEVAVQPNYNQSQEAEDRFMAAWTKFEEYKENRNQSIRFFNKNGVTRNIIEYVKDSVDRMNEHHLKPEWKEDWQSNVFDPVTRNKVITVLSKIASSRMAIEVLVKSNSIFNTADSKQRARIYKDLLDAANEHNREDEQLIWEMYTGMTEGTVIGYEGIMKDKRKAKFVKEYNPDTGEMKTEDIEYDSWDDVFGEIVPIEEFYPETIWVNSRDFKTKIKRCFRVREMTMDGFKDLHGKKPNAEYVQPAGNYFDMPGFEWGISHDIGRGNVQVIEWFDEQEDKHCIWANGIELQEGPIEFNHKRKPFWISISEPIHHQFLYGKSFPDKMMAMQDMDNGMINAIFDQLLMAIQSPVFVDGDIDDLDSGYLEPNRIYKMEQGTKIQRGGLAGLDQTSLQVLSLIKRSLEESSISSEAQGIATGGRKTKYEVQLLQENALGLAGLFLQLMETAMRDKYLLRLYNVLQYYSQSTEAMDGSTRFKFLVLENKKLNNGKMGKKMIQIVPSLNGKTSEQVSGELATMAAEEQGMQSFDPLKSKIEPVVITQDYLLNKDVELDIKIVPNSSVKESGVQKKNADIAFYQMTNQDPGFDQTKNKQDLAAAFSKDPDIVKDPSEQAAQPDPLQEQMNQAMKSMGPKNSATQPNIDNPDMGLL